MGKRISIVIATALTLCVLLVSCGGGGGGGGGGAAPAANTSSSYSGSFSVNGGNYSTVALNSTNNTATVSGSSGTLSGTYASNRSISDGTYTITFSGGTIVITISGSSITLSTGTWSASGNGTLQNSTNNESSSNESNTSSDNQSSSGESNASSGSQPSSGETNTSSGNSSSVNVAAQEQAIYNSLLGTHWKYEEVPLAQRGTSSDPLNPSRIPMPNGILYGYFDLTISANGILELSGRFEYGDGSLFQEMHSSVPSSSMIEFFDTPYNFSIHIESASSRAAIFVNVNGQEERLEYINIGDSNGDGIYDTPREDTANHEGTNKFFTKLN